MAVDICSEDQTPTTTPPFSFSHHLHHPDDISPIRPSDSDADFSFWDGNFCTINEPSSADELFSDGLIRPLYIQQQTSQTYKHISISKPQSLASHHLPPLPLPPKRDSLKETEPEPEPEPRPQSKSFWRIKRSTSLHCQTSHKKSPIWSLPLLSRSNSTGSVPNSKPSSSPSKDCKKPNSQKQPRNSLVKSSSSNAYTYPLSQKPPLGKHYAGSYDNGGWISPVLNVPPPYISKRASGFLGLNSLFGNGKDHKNNRK